MDLIKTIRDLCIERDKLDAIIVSLEQLERQSPQLARALKQKRRGRKYMNAEARKEVSERMKKYWNTRRNREPQEPSSRLSDLPVNGVPSPMIGAAAAGKL